MRASTAQAFCKQKLCPAATSLAAYHQPGLDEAARQVVAQHLKTCEFCYQEAYFLQRCLPATNIAATETYAHVLPPNEIPPHLKRLAEDILGRERRAASDRIVELVSSPRPTLTRDF